MQTRNHLMKEFRTEGRPLISIFEHFPEFSGVAVEPRWQSTSREVRVSCKSLHLIRFAGRPYLKEVECQWSQVESCWECEQCVSRVSESLRANHTRGTRHSTQHRRCVAPQRRAARPATPRGRPAIAARPRGSPRPCDAYWGDGAREVHCGRPPPLITGIRPYARYHATASQPTRPRSCPRGCLPRR